MVVWFFLGLGKKTVADSPSGVRWAWAERWRAEIGRSGAESGGVGRSRAGSGRLEWPGWVADWAPSGG